MHCPKHTYEDNAPSIDDICFYLYLICPFDDVDKVLLKHQGTLRLLLQNPTRKVECGWGFVDKIKNR